MKVFDSNPYFTAYWFNLATPQHQKSPGDVKIAQTVICSTSTSRSVSAPYRRNLPDSGSSL